MSITRYFDLYLNAGKTIPLVINANQYDESEQWVFTLYTDTGVKYTPSSGSIVGIKSDGYLIANAGTVDEQGRVVITETQQMTAAAGKAVFELQIDNETHGTANFIVLVEPDPSNNGIASGSDIGLLRDALNGGLSQAAIEALLACFENVAWIGDDGQDYYDALEAALNAVRGISLDVSTLSFVGSGQTQQLTATTIPAGGTVSWESSNTSVATVSNSGLVTSAGVGTATITASSGDVSATCSVTVTQATLVSIDAVYTQSGTVYDTDSLDSLKADLVVTATWSNSSTSTVASTDYTLSGTLTEGTSTITVSYGGKTDTFNVTVTQYVDTFVYGLVDSSSAVTGSYITDTGVVEETTAQSGYYADYIDLYGRNSVLIHYVPSAGNKNFRISIYDSDKVFTRQLHQESSDYETVSLNTGERYIRLGWYLDSTSYTCKFYIESTSPTALLMEIGSINSSGVNETSDHRLRSEYIAVSSTITVEDVAALYSLFATTNTTNGGCFFRCYDSNYTVVGTLIGANSKFYVNDLESETLPTNTAYVRMLIQRLSTASAFSAGFSTNIHPFVIDGISYQITEAS